MNELPALLLLLSSSLCCIYQLAKGFKDKDLSALALSISFASLLGIKLAAIAMNRDFGSNYQYITLFPLSILLILKSLSDLQIHLFLRCGFVSAFFLFTLPAAINVNDGQLALKVLQEKASFLNTDKRVLNILFHADEPFIEEIAQANVHNLGIQNTMLFSVPILTDQFKRVSSLKGKYQYINLVNVELGEEKTAAETLEVYLSKNYEFKKMDFKGLFFKENIFQSQKQVSYKNTLFERK